MHLLMISAALAALSLWIGGMRRRRDMHRRHRAEVDATLGTGLPSPETAVGQKAKSVSEAQQHKLSQPPRARLGPLGNQGRRGLASRPRLSGTGRADG